jgi:hypothetical protein
MTDLVEAMVTEPEKESGKSGRRVLWMMLAGVGIVFVAGGIAGYLSEHASQGGGPLGMAGTLVLSVFALAILGFAYSIWRNGQKIRISGAPAGRRDRMYQRAMVTSGLLGGLIAIILLISGDVSGEPSVFTDTPIAPWVAILLALVVGVGVPAFSWHWHNRVIDEQEADAYRTGALIAVYVYWIGAPVWWILWRGGLVAAPDGIAIYMITMIAASAIWFWKKYR